MLEKLPKDPVILLSTLNTKLRDMYASLDELCEELEVSRHVLEETLEGIDYRYNEEENQFE